MLVKIDGCFSGDGDWDAPSYQTDWPGTDPNAARDRALHPSSVLFTSPKTNDGTTNYSTIAFEADLPRIEASDSQDNPPFCNTTTGENCVNPPTGAQFYPFFSTRSTSDGCTWQEGGDFIPGTTNDFGGSSTTEFGPLLATVFPTAGPTGPTTVTRYDNFNSGDLQNPCPAIDQRNLIRSKTMGAATGINKPPLPSRRISECGAWLPFQNTRHGSPGAADEGTADVRVRR